MAYYSDPESFKCTEKERERLQSEKETKRRSLECDGERQKVAMMDLYLVEIRPLSWRWPMRSSTWLILGRSHTVYIPFDFKLKGCMALL
jgi:hypothetical protein